MEKPACLMELNKILNLAKRCEYLWVHNSALEIEFYSSMPEQDEGANISLVRNHEFGFNANGTYFNSQVYAKRKELSPEELFGLASKLLENKALKCGDLFNNFKRILRLPLGYYLADKELSKL